MFSLYKLNKKGLEKELGKEDFIKEKEIQNIFEESLKNNFFPNLVFLDSEYSIFFDKYNPKIKKQVERIDTLAYYPRKGKKGTFVIIEYKNKESREAVGQILGYLNSLRHNKENQWQLISTYWELLRKNKSERPHIENFD
jgi:hypothetical protein